MKGKIILITGCMFSGKTTRVITMAKQALAGEKSIEIYYPEIDTRYTKNYITSHDALQLPSKAIPIDTQDIAIGTAEFVFLDELHFFKESVIDAIQKLRDNGITVVVSGLDKDFRGDSFALTEAVRKSADEVIVLVASCVVCQKPATYSQRVVGNHFAKKDDKTIVIGGEDMYEARCEEHFIKPE